MMKTPSHRFHPLVFCLIAGALLWHPTTAGALVFDFRTAPAAPPSEYFIPGLTMSNEWAQLTASANWPRFLYQDQYGLGVTGGPFAPGDDPQIDGNNPAEMVQIQFTQNVLLQSVTFTRLSNVSPSDWAMAFVDTSIVAFTPLPGGDPTDTGTYTLDLSGMATNLRTGSVFKFAAFSPSDDFQIGAITVDRAPGAPLPTSFGAGLLMFGIIATHNLMKRPVRASA